MNFRIKSLEMPNRNKLKIKSLAQLLDKEPIPLPQDSLQNNLLQKYSSQSSRLHNHHLHKRRFSHQDNMRQTFSHKINVKSNVLESLRKTWHPEEKQQQQVKLRTAGASHQRHQSLELNFHKRIKPKIQQQITPILKKKQQSKKQDTQESKFTPQCKKPVHNFLRKGSSINRQVVVNILKLKIGKHSDKINQQNENQQILKMIRLYKGYGQDPQLIPKLQNIKKSSKINEIDKDQNPFRNRNLLQKSIMGWKQKSDEQQDYQYNQLNLQADQQI